MVHYQPSKVNQVSEMLDRRLNVAPMMGCTDRHCRYLLRLISPHSVLYTEMIVTGALIYGDRDHFLAHEGDAPCALQLGGSDPDELAQCARMAADAGYQEVNVNVGCPSDRVQNNRIGACLMAEPEHVARCFSAMQEKVDIPVTIKTRIGIDDHDSYEFFERFASTLCEAGCQTLIIHARKAILSGLSPRENREVPPLQYTFVERIKRTWPDRQFILNGGIDNVDDAIDLLGRFDGIMLGRAAYDQPFILSALESALYGQDIVDRFSIVRDYQTYIERQASQGEHIKYMAKHLFGLFAGQPGARKFRRYLSEHMFADDAGPEIVDQAVGLISNQMPLARAS